MSPTEVVRTLHRQMTQAIWTQALARKNNLALSAHVAATQREAIDHRLRHLASRWNSNEHLNASLP